MRIVPRKTPYRLLVLDVDGTLVAPGVEVSPDLIGVLSDCRSMGMIVVIATGKHPRDVRSLSLKIGLDGPLIACNGAIVVDTRSGTVIGSHWLPSAEYCRLLEWLARKGLAPVVFLDEGIAAVSSNPATEALLTVGECVTKTVFDLYALSRQNIAKVLAVPANGETLTEWHEEARNEFGDILSVTISSAKFLEFMAAGVSKGNEVQRIAARHGIVRGEVVCIGDSDNDCRWQAVIVVG